MIRIRDATADDLNVLLALGSLMRAESIERYPPTERAHARKSLEAAIAMPGNFLIILAEDEKYPVGMMAAIAGPYSFSSRLRAASDLLFVIPERRGGTAAMRLVRRFKEWAGSVGADSATLSVATGVSPERTGRFFKVMGFGSMEMTYRMDYN